MKPWIAPTVEIARATPENMPRLTYAIQRGAHPIATLRPRDFRREFPEFCFLSKDRARYWPRRLAIAQVVAVAAIHIDHGRQLMQYPVATVDGNGQAHGIAPEAGLRPRRAWLAMDDLRRAGWLRSAKQRKIEKPAEPGKGRRFIGVAVRRHVEQIMYRRLDVAIEAAAAKKRHDDNKDEAAQLEVFAAAARAASELRRTPRIGSAPSPAPLVITPEEKAAAIARMSSWRAGVAAAEPAGVRTTTGPPPDDPPE